MNITLLLGYITVICFGLGCWSYFASLKNRFILLEDAFNYKTRRINEHCKLDHKLELMLWDKSTEGNVLNGRMVDYGYIQQFDKMSYFLQQNPGIRK